MISLRTAKPKDAPAIRSINELAFGQPDEARLVDALRDSGCVVLELVAETNGRLTGHILFSELQIESPERTVRAAALAPLAIHPDYQRRGIGSALIKMSIPMLAHAGFDAVVVVGHEEYYPRFGFSAEAASTLQHPFPPGPHFMALEITPGTLEGFNGRVHYAPAFGL